MTIDEAIKILNDNNYIIDDTVNEDFGMGVGAPLGADQGIPQSKDCCAVPMMRLGDPAPFGRIQKMHPHYDTVPPFWLRSDMTIGKIKRKKKKRKHKKHIKESIEINSKGNDFEDFKEEVIEAMGINRSLASKIINRYEDDVISEFENNYDAESLAYKLLDYAGI